MVKACPHYGFVAMLFKGLSAILVLLRHKLLRVTKKMSRVRAIHVIVSALSRLLGGS